MKETGHFIPGDTSTYTKIELPLAGREEMIRSSRDAFSVVHKADSIPGGHAFIYVQGLYEGGYVE